MVRAESANLPKKHTTPTATRPKYVRCRELVRILVPDLSAGPASHEAVPGDRQACTGCKNAETLADSDDELLADEIRTRGMFGGRCTGSA
jgi:hypothetical protein